MDLGESVMTVGKLPSNNVDSVSLPLSEEERPDDMSDEEYEDFIDKKLSGKAKKQLEQKAYVLEEIRDFVELKPNEAAQVVRAIMATEET